ncbi:hypothetical protein N9955_00580 [bacterium]|nr:hypothetical protein [bacterium]
MKITKDLAAKLIEESPSFREHIFNQLGFAPAVDTQLVEELISCAIVPVAIAQDKNPEGSYKITAIKAVRDAAIEGRFISRMKQQFPDAIQDQQEWPYCYCSLVWAKNFVEKYQYRINY